MRQKKSDGLFWISLIMILLISIFLISWDVLNMVEKLQPENVFTISWAVRIFIFLTAAVSLVGVILEIIEIKKEKSRKLLIRLIVNLIALLLFVFIVILYSTRDSEKNSYNPPDNAIYSYEEIRIKLPSGDILAGSLTYPKDIKEKIPGVILITGSSPHDRDNSSPEEPRTAYRPFRQIADRLSSNGIAVLRMDNRGIGESIGGDIRNMTTEERAKDIEECIRYLRHRSEFDSLRIGLIGLSEGVSVSHMIASHDTLIKALVFLSGIGSPGKDVLEYQIQQGVLTKDQLAILLREDKNTHFLYEFDPLKTAGKIKQPVLIIHGKKDRSVNYTDAYKLEEAITRNGNKNVTLKILEGYDHTLLKVNPNGQFYSAKISDEVLMIITDWILKEI
jgi:dipeptidyl aminopeptidase/acylaminoacyl peptidase